jgi:hypothetical protein
MGVMLVMAMLLLPLLLRQPQGRPLLLVAVAGPTSGACRLMAVRRARGQRQRPRRLPGRAHALPCPRLLLLLSLALQLLQLLPDVGWQAAGGGRAPGRLLLLPGLLLCLPPRPLLHPLLLLAPRGGRGSGGSRNSGPCSGGGLLRRSSLPPKVCQLIMPLLGALCRKEGRQATSRQ